MTAIKPGNPSFVPPRANTGDLPAVSTHKNTGPAVLGEAQQALHSNYIQSLLEYANSGSQGEAPVAAGSLPEPDPMHSAAQPGEGLKHADSKWPKGSVTTAGGWTVVPKGNAEWDIFAPGQKSSEKPMSKIWGDPHVEGQNGHDFDFSKSSDFLLPDGTRILCTNTAETGHSLSSQLDIVNGADHVTVSGVNTGSPSTSAVKSDGFGWRESHMNNDHNRETFKLGGSVSAAAWFKQVDNIDQGQVSGADFKDGSYKQTTDNAKFYWVDSKLKPALGSKAYQEQMQNNLGDLLGSLKLPPDMVAMLSNAVYGGGVDRSATDPLAAGGTPDPLFLGYGAGASSSASSASSAPTNEAAALGGLLPWKPQPGDILGLGDVWKNLQALGDTANNFSDMMAGLNNQRMRFF